MARWALGVIFGTAGKYEEAVSTLESLAEMSGRHSRAIVSLAVVFGHWGKIAEAAALYRELLERSVQGYAPHSYLCLAADAAGLREEALTLARRAWEEREVTFTLHVRHFPEFRTLRADPRFAALLREMDS